MKQFYVGLGALIEKDDKVLVLRRSPDKDVASNVWEPVTGRLETEESPEEGVLREVEEEVALKVEVVMPIDTAFFYRGGKEFPMVFIAFWCRYLEGEVKLSWEHSEYKWITLEEATNNPELGFFNKGFAMIKKLKKNLPRDFRI